MFIPVIATIFALASSAVSATQLVERQAIVAPVQVSLPDVTLPARIVVGDPTCPASTGNTVNVNVFAAVRLDETLRASLIANGNIGGLVNVPIQTNAKVSTEVLTCVCVDAAVGVNLLDVATSLRTAARTDLNADIVANANGDATITAVQGLLTSAGVVTNFNLSPTESNLCTCPDPATRPICFAGACACQDCPFGQIYNGATGECAAVPSGMSARRRARSLAAIHRPRQAGRT